MNFERESCESIVDVRERLIIGLDFVRIAIIIIIILVIFLFGEHDSHWIIRFL